MFSPNHLVSRIFNEKNADLHLPLDRSEPNSVDANKFTLQGTVLKNYEQTTLTKIIKKIANPNLTDYRELVYM